MTTLLKIEPSNRIMLPRDLRRVAGVGRGQLLKASATPGRIVLEVAPAACGEVVDRGRLRVWTGAVPPIPLAEAVDATRRCQR